MEQFRFRRMQSGRPQQQCRDDEEAGSRRARTELERAMGSSVRDGKDMAATEALLRGRRVSRVTAKAQSARQRSWSRGSCVGGDGGVEEGASCRERVRPEDGGGGGFGGEAWPVGEGARLGAVALWHVVEE